MQSTPKDTGWIEVICGSMFSGKTEELLRRIRRAQIAKLEVALFKPRIDDRYSRTEVVSHDKRKLDAIAVANTEEILEKAKDYEVVGIDEAQFFGMGLVETCEELANAGKRVIVSGLDQDYRGVPFEPIPQLLAVAEYITKNLAICMVCGNPADRNQRMIQSTDRVLVGGEQIYEARCRKCFHPGGPPKEETTATSPQVAHA